MNNRWQRALIATLLLLHITGHIVLSACGVLAPFELFNLILLGANAVIATFLWWGKGDFFLGVGAMFLIGTHAMMGQKIAPDSLTGGTLLLVNILVLYTGLQLFKHLPARYGVLFAASYFALYAIFILLLENAAPLFLLFLMGLCACARSFRMLAYFWTLTFAFTFAQPYAWQSCFLIFLLLTAVFSARGELGTPLVLVFLVLGLTWLLLVLFPVVIIIFGEDAHNIWPLLGDARIRSSLETTAVTATVSTVILLFCGVPLAYALSRLRFKGKSLVLAMIDVPIIIPQSVAGIVLLRACGRQQPLGELLHTCTGLYADGTILGICIAQIFVAAPFLIKSSLSAFENVSEGLEMTACTLGASPWSAFRRVALPLASRGIFIGTVLAWARAAGEFGALLLIAPTPETASVAVWNRFNSIGLVETGPLVAMLLLFSLVMFFLLQFAGRLLPSQFQRTGGNA